MHLSLFDQGEIFRLAFLFGLVLGVYYDLFRFIRALGFTSGRAVFFQDLVFMSSCSVLCFFFAQAFLHGHFRLFVFCSHIIGFVAYRVSVGACMGVVYKIIGSSLYKIMSYFEHASITFGQMLHKIGSAYRHVVINFSKNCKNTVNNKKSSLN